MRNHIVDVVNISIAHHHFHVTRVQYDPEYRRIFDILQLRVKGLFYISQEREFAAYDAALLDRCHKGFSGEVMSKQPSFRPKLATLVSSRVSTGNK